ncbi:hypothetical protein [Pseudokineococcus lusitanus]|uniref:Pilus assembly protein PilO n=1 Tax=Pseudokineococcus lusitanus TaxID=763993 RepID=A0A3N1G9C2_9ACTN|nr:hypothetical protein [Pseudokineococcus lusitanus]ROP26826.1 hypothetical protein EDC03_3063 [Pseudokineococcus lusitanus]
MQLTRTRLWVGGAALAALALTTGSWFGLVAPRHDEAAALREQTSSVASQNDVLETRIAGLEAQLAELPARRAEAAALREQLPAQADLPSLIRQLSALADRSGTTLVGVTPTEPTAAAAAAPTTAADPAAVPADAAAPVATTDGTAAAEPGGLETVPVAVTATGTFAQVQELLRLVQTELPRAVLVKDASMTAADTGVDLAVTADVFVLPLTAQEEQLALAAAPAATPAPTATPAPAADDAATVDAAGTSTQEPM